MKTCVLVANAGFATLYITENPRTQELKKIRSWEHEKSRMRKNELITNVWGGSPSATGAPRGACERTDPKEFEAEYFAGKLANELGKIKKHFPDYPALIVIAGPHFQGLIKKHLDSPFKKTMFISKNYGRLKPETVLKHIREYLYG